LPLRAWAEPYIRELRPAADARRMKGAGKAVETTPPAAAVKRERLETLSIRPTPLVTTGFIAVPWPFSASVKFLTY